MTIANRADRSQTQLAGVAGRGVGDDVEAPERALIDETQLDSDFSDTATVAADLAAHAARTLKVSVVDGEDETTTHQITVTGMVAADTVVAVLVLTTKASIATAAAHAGTLTAAAGKITPGTEVNNTGNQYLVFWIDAA